MCSSYTHTRSILSVTFLLSFILRSLNTNAHNQTMLSEPPCSRTGLSACSWIAIRSRIADNAPIYRLRKFFKGAAELWMPADTAWWMFVKAHASHTTRLPTKKKRYLRKMSVYEKIYIRAWEKLSNICYRYIWVSFKMVLEAKIKKQKQETH